MSQSGIRLGAGLKKNVVLLAEGTNVMLLTGGLVNAVAAGDLW